VNLSVLPTAPVVADVSAAQTQRILRKLSQGKVVDLAKDPTRHVSLERSTTKTRWYNGTSTRSLPKRPTLPTKDTSMSRNRREFLNASFSVGTAFGISAAFSSLGSRLARGASGASKSTLELIPVKDEATELSLLRLPEGFRYVSYGWTHDVMADGVKTPSSHDGMGVVRMDGNIATMVRNHEVNGDGQVIATDRLRPYDSMGNAGCTTLRFDVKRGVWTDSHVSFAGSVRNCAGGITPWGTWLTCEETVLGPQSIDTNDNNVVRSYKKTHGWIFEVPADGLKEPLPITDMGRFKHEAIAIDHATGIVYETEDQAASGFYRYVPSKPGDLAAGGILEMAEVIGYSDLTGCVPAGAEYDVRWHKIDDPTRAHSPWSGATPDELGVYYQGKEKGGTTFARLEGCWFGNDSIYFDATNGGGAKAGQIWRYDPKTSKLKLLLESPAKEVLNMPDNLCVNPKGGLILCEDNAFLVDECPHRMFILTQDGQLRLFAQNNIVLDVEKNTFKGDFRNQEWCGATFSPDGQWLFVNIQSPGITFAITGPWDAVL
jgi:hypothetical protein